MARYGRPQVVSGRAGVEGDGTVWRVTAGAVTDLELRLPLRSLAFAGTTPAASLLSPAASVSDAAPQQDAVPPSIRATQ